MTLVWDIKNNGVVIDTFATGHNITKDEALKLRDIECDEENLFYDDIEVELRKEKW